MQMIIAKDFYNYFRDCYKLDYKEFIVENLLSAKYKYNWFVSEKEELLNGLMPYIPYNNLKIDDLEKELELYKLEKKLFYGCFFVLGKTDNPLVKDKRICSPLLLFPATIITDDGLKYLKIESDSLLINRAILSKLELKTESLSKDMFISELSDRICDYSENAMWLNRLLDKYFGNQNSEELLLFPKLWDIKELKSFYSNGKHELGEFTVVPAAGTILIDKSVSSLRVLEDMESMSSQNQFNTSLEELLGKTPEKESFDSSYFRSRLNPEQYHALQNANIYTNSVIIGPPGTGKSYTISTIIADAVVKGKSVLVASKTKQAVEVIRNMLQQDFRLRDFIIHTSGTHYKISLKAKLKRYLSGILSKNTRALNNLRISNLSKQLSSAESLFQNIVEKELKLSELEFKEHLSFSEIWKRLFLKLGRGNGEEIWDVFRLLNEISRNLEKELKVYAKQRIDENIRLNSTTYRQDLALYYDGLDSASFSEYKDILSRINHENVLKVFPIWLVNLSELNAVLPLQKEIFDLVIIDEATQCDIASALPAIYRAKKVVIAGDPNQLRHYSFVSDFQQKIKQRQYNLPADKIFDYRNRSVLDLFISKVQQQDQVTFLREHYRSTPSIIQFSNEHFYENQLEIIKTTPEYTNSLQIELNMVDGERDSKGINKKEAEAVIHKLDKIIKEYSDFKDVPSIGIISPFNSQVSFINSILKQKYDLNTIKKYDLLCGTPYNFQGSEREIVLISFGVCKNTHHSAYFHLNRPEVMNVAITRAKSYQYVFSSVSENEIRNESLLGQYLSFIKNYAGLSNKQSSMDKFQNEVVEALKEKDIINVNCGYPVAGNLLDILIVHKNKNFFIDLIGYPGQFTDAFTIERYKTLGRTGIKCMPLHYSYWKKSKEKAVQRIMDFVTL